MRLLKLFIALLLALSAVSCEQREIHIDELVMRDNLLYVGSSNSPYTGKAFERYENGQIKSERTFKDGKLHGLNVDWHKNGQKREEGNFNNGVHDGKWIVWDSKGNIKQETIWKDNLLLNKQRY